VAHLDRHRNGGNQRESASPSTLLRRFWRDRAQRSRHRPAIQAISVLSEEASCPHFSRHCAWLHRLNFLGQTWPIGGEPNVQVALSNARTPAWYCAATSGFRRVISARAYRDRLQATLTDNGAGEDDGAGEIGCRSFCCAARSDEQPPPPPGVRESTPAAQQKPLQPMPRPSTSPDGPSQGGRGKADLDESRAKALRRKPRSRAQNSRALLA